MSKPKPEVAVSGAPVPPASPKWTALVDKFAATTGLGADVVGPKLTSLTGTEDDAGVELLENAADTPDADVKAQFAEDKVAPARLNKAVREMRAAPVESKAAEMVQTASVPVPMTSVILPDVPAGLSLLQRLRVGGVLKVKTDTLVGAVRVLFTERAGYFDIVEKLAAKIEDRAEKNGRAVPAIYLKLDSLVKGPEYAEMLNLLREDGITDRRRYASKAEKEKLFVALQPIFKEFAGVQRMLENYLEQMMIGGNPQVMMQALLGSMSGQPNPALAMMMQPPPPTAVIAAVNGMIERINKMFGGTRAITATAFQPEIAGIAAILDNEELYAAVGTTDKEEMLNEIGLGASTDLSQLEQDILKYMLSVLDIPNKDSQSQSLYIGAVAMLGKNIDWERVDEIVYGRSKPNGANRPLPGQGNKTFG